MKKMDKKITLDIHNYKESWEFFTNDRLLDIVKNLLGPDIFYLHTPTIIREDEKDFQYAWHRDSTFKQFGNGPDWDKNEPYNVLSLVTYLSSYDTTRSGINLIPCSHKRSYTLSNIFRFLHSKIKDISLFKNIRDIIPRFIGVNIKTEPGDCVIFLANLYHTGIPPRTSRHALKKVIVVQYGVDNKHSKNLVNFYLDDRIASGFYPKEYKYEKHTDKN